MASIYYGPDCIATDIECDSSLRGISKALASILTRAQYRRVYRGYSDQRTSSHMRSCAVGWIAFVATRNDDGSQGPTYTLVSEELSRTNRQYED